MKFGTSNAKKMTLAFWVKATKTGTNVVRMYAPDDNRSCSISYTISSSNTWEHKVLNFPADTTGVIDDDNGSGIDVGWGLSAGSGFTSGTLATTWASNTSANDFVGQVNHLDSTSNNFHITGIQLEVGEFSSTTLPPFQHEDFGDNLSRCERYYQTICEGTDKPFGMGHYWEAQEFIGHRVLPTTMRTAPTLEYVSATNYYAILRNGGSDQFNDLSISSSPKTGNMITWYCGSGQGIASSTKNFPGFFRTQNSNAHIAMTAEL